MFISGNGTAIPFLTSEIILIHIFLYNKIKQSLHQKIYSNFKLPKCKTSCPYLINSGTSIPLQRVMILGYMISIKKCDKMGECCNNNNNFY